MSRLSRRRLASSLGVVLLSSILGCHFNGRTALTSSAAFSFPLIGAPSASDDPSVLRGQEIFNAKGCVYCHGPNGQGGVKNNNAVGGLIPALTRVAEGYSDAELKERILKGSRDIAKASPDGPTPPLYMPAWRPVLTDSDLEELIAFLKSLMPKEKAEW